MRKFFPAAPLSKQPLTPEQLTKALGLALLFLIVLSFGFALFGTGASYHGSRFIRQQKSISTTGLFRDKWLASHATWSFRQLAQNLNNVTFTFSTVGRRVEQPARVRVLHCDTEIFNGPIVTDGQSVTFPLSGACPSDKTEVFTSNLIRSSFTNDTRDLGVMLKDFKVSSKVRLPIASAEHLTVWTLLLFVASASILLCLRSLRLTVPLAILSVATWGILLSRSHFMGWNELEHAVLLFSSLILALGATRIALESPRLRFLILERARAPMPILWEKPILAVIILFGAILRISVIHFGLPDYYHRDELSKANVITNMFERNSWDPQYFLHPSLLLYLSIGMESIYEWLGLPLSKPNIILAGRTVSAIAGILTIPIVAVVMRRLLSPTAGLLTAAFIAFAPLHITCSRYMKEDVLLLFFVMLACAAMLKAAQDKKPLFLLAAGVAAGFAAGTKYTGMLTGCVIVAGPWLASKRFVPDWKFARWVPPALLCGVLGFIATTPYSIINFQEFSGDFSAEQRHMLKGHNGVIDAVSQYWMYHFSRSVFPGLTTLTAALGVFGIGLLLYRRRIEDLFLVAMLLLFYLPAEWVRAKPAPQPERYILPILPFLAAGAAEVLRLARERYRVAGTAFASLVVLIAGVRSIQLTYEVAHDTRPELIAWMRANLPADTKIIVEGGYSADFEDIFNAKMVYALRAPQEIDVQKLKESGYDYFVVNSLSYDRYFSQPNTPDAIKRRFAKVFNELPLVKEMRPEHGTYGFHNPTMRLYALKSPAPAATPPPAEATQISQAESSPGKI